MNGEKLYTIPKTTTVWPGIISIGGRPNNSRALFKNPLGIKLPSMHMSEENSSDWQQEKKAAGF